MKLYCRYCEINQDGEMCDNGAIACGNCGNVIMENNLVEDVTYIKGPGGQSRMDGAFVRSWDIESASTEMSYNRGYDQIRRLIMLLNIDDKVEDMANTFYRRVARRNFTRRYRIDYVAAACLYVACRAQEQPYLLIDFSEKLLVNVYVIGAVYLQLCQLLYLEDDPIVQKPVDPSLFIHKFTTALVQKSEDDSGSKMNKVEAINRTALSIIGSMKRDWMQTGRKPSGLCGAAIYIAALSHGYRFPKSEVINVVHICEATLTKRLIEFENTESGSLTIQEFEERAKDFESEHLYLCTEKSDRTEVLCEHKDEKVYAHGLCQECDEKFIKLSGGLEGGADPPAFQRFQSKEVSPNSLKKVQDTSVQHKNIMMAPAEKLAEQQYENLNHDSVNYKESEDLTNDDPDCLSDIDDNEVNCYLNNDEEKHYKKIIWERMNKEYMEEQALKEAEKLAAGTHTDNTEMTDEIREAQKLAAAANAAVLAKKEKRKQMTLEAKNAAPPRTAAEATAGVLNNKGLRNYNIDALERLFDEDGVEVPSKKSRKDAEDEVKVGGTNASDEKQEEEDNVTNYMYDEVDQDYQDPVDYDSYPYTDNVDQDYQAQADYEPDPYTNNDQYYYDGNDEPDNLSYGGED